MSELDPDAIRDEAAERLVDLALSVAIADRAESDALTEIVTAAASDAELLARAHAAALRFKERSPRAPMDRAIDLLGVAVRHATG